MGSVSGSLNQQRANETFQSSYSKETVFQDYQDLSLCKREPNDLEIHVVKQV